MDFVRKHFFFQMPEVDSSSRSFLRGTAIAEIENDHVANMLNEKKAMLILDLDNTILHSIEMAKVTEEIMTDLEDYFIIPR